MTDIDWSKAPAEATHYGPKREDNDMWCAVFWTVVNGIGIKAWQIDNKTGDLTQYSKPTWCPEDLHRLIPRPAVWTGEGLPPVGTVCEAVFTSELGEYYKAKILAHDYDRIVFRWIEGPAALVLSEYSDDRTRSYQIFRPIRTPEQIAAEEREKAIDEMYSLTRTSSSQEVIYAQRHVCERLYDAGYRKTEAP